MTSTIFPRTSRRFLAPARLLLLLCAGLFSSASPASAQDPLAGFAEYAEAARRAWEIPGMAIAVVRDDSVVFARGFGVRAVGQSGAVDERTSFRIGSISKTMTATLLAMQVEQGRISWEDPVTGYLPDLRLPGPFAEAITIRDLLAHRSGIPGINYSLTGSLSRPEVLRRLQHGNPSTSLRERFAYNNHGYLVAALAGAARDSAEWDEMIRERIFRPLGMLASGTRDADLDRVPNAAVPHARIEGAARPVVPFELDNISPAGGVHSTAADLAQWLRLHLGQGTVDGKALLKPETVREIQSPQVMVPISASVQARWPSTHFVAYGLGWFLRDYRGIKIVEHGGNVTGMTAQIALVPEKRLGLVVLTNMDRTTMPTALMYQIIDAHLGASDRDWSAELLAAVRRAQQSPAQDSAVVGTPMFPLERYEGAFESPVYGPAKVSLSQGRLVLELTTRAVAELEPRGAHEFALRWRDPFLAEVGARGPVVFEMDAAGVPTILRVRGIADYTRKAPVQARIP